MAATCGHLCKGNKIVKLRNTLLLAGSILLTSLGVVKAQDVRFDPSARCILVLGDTSESNVLMAGAWASGFLSTGAQKPEAVDLAIGQKLILEILDICKADFAISFVDAIREVKQRQVGPPGSLSQARAMLSEFLKPDADRVALTAAIMPNEADVRAVYADPLATKMWESYRGLIKPGLAFGPKQGQTELLTIYATTAQLKSNDAVLDQFPGGYRKVLDYMQGDYPIIRFKFVKPGETLGMAYDGLVYVNGRWAIIPKPWRALD